MLAKMTNLLDRMYIKAYCWASGFMRDESGDVNIVSMVVLIGIAVALAVIFRKQVGDLLTTLFNSINKSATNAVA